MTLPGTDLHGASQPLESAASKPKRRTILFSILLLPAIIFLVIVAGFVLNRAYQAIPYPFQLDSEEGFLLNQALLLSKGQTIYKPLDHYPFVVGNYGPVYPLLNVVPLLFFEPSLSYGRFISFLAFLGIVILMIRLVDHEVRNALFALLSPLLFIATYDLYEWIAYMRVDLLAICLSLCGLTLIASGERLSFKVGAIACFVLALYTKQTELAAPLACIVYLILKERIRGVRFGLLLLLSVLAVFTLLNLITRGEFFKHTVVYNANIFDIWQLKRWILHIVRFNKFYLLGITVTIVYYLMNRLRTRSTSSIDLFALYFLFALISIFGIAKKGSAPNYLLEPYVAFSLFFCINAARLMELTRQNTRLIAGKVAYALLTTLVLVHCVNLYLWMPALLSPHNPDASDYRKGDLALTYFLASGDEIISEMPIFNIMSNKPVLFQPFIMAQLASEGKWDETPLIADVARQRFSLILTTQDLSRESDFFFRYSRAFVHAANRSYQLDNKLDFGRGLKYFLYVPKQIDGSARRELALAPH
jgi:hypothetical protein